jgi:hypothetical protein
MFPKAEQFMERGLAAPSSFFPSFLLLLPPSVVQLQHRVLYGLSYPYL